MTPLHLADTHVVLWGWHQPERLRLAHRSILSSDQPVAVSIATAWEIAIKVSLGKLRTVDDVPAALEASGYSLLPITLDHVEEVRTLPLHHRDPFDRMLIAQARTEGLAILTVDRDFSAYDVMLA